MIKEELKIYLPFDELQKHGGVVINYKDRWWTCHPEKGVLFYKRRVKDTLEQASPQCNQDETTSKILSAKLWPDHEVRFFPSVLQPIDPRDYND